MPFSDYFFKIISFCKKKMIDLVIFFNPKSKNIMKQQITSSLLVLLFISITANLFGQSSVVSTTNVENLSTDYTFTIVTDGAGVAWNFVDVYPVTGSTFPSVPGNIQPSALTAVDVFIDDSPTEAVGYLRNLGGYIRFDHSAALPMGTKIEIIVKGVGNPGEATGLETKVVFNTNAGVPITTYSTTMDIITAPLGTEELEEETLKLFPTVASDELYFENVVTNMKYAIFDVGTTKLVKKGSITSNQEAIDVRSMSTGMYLLRVTDATSSKAYKFFKQ